MKPITFVPLLVCCVSAAPLLATGCGPPGGGAGPAEAVRPPETCDPADPAIIAASTVTLSLMRVVPDENDTVVGLGGGVVIEPGVVLTASHVVESAQEIVAVPTCVTAAGKAYRCGTPVQMRVIGDNPPMDGALLEPRYPESQPLTVPPIAIAPRQPREGEELHALLVRAGWADGRLLQDDVPFESVARLAETSVQAMQGDSGSPFVDHCGRLIGFLSHAYEAGNSYYVPIWTREDRRP